MGEQVVNFTHSIDPNLESRGITGAEIRANAEAMKSLFWRLMTEV
jgi:hypothetical protein